MVDTNNDSDANGAVVIRLVGGLGNQMFQYAAALGLAVRQNRILKIDTSGCVTCENRPYQLDCLKVPQNFYTGAQLFQPDSNSIAARVIQRIKRAAFKADVFRKGVYREPHYHFDTEFFDLSGTEILLNGYFQSPRYFKSVAKLLRERFQPAEPLSAMAADWAAKIAASPCSVSLHVRRGDYLEAPHSALQDALDRGYYDRAVNLIQCLARETVEFFLFSDEPDFVAEAFADLPRAHVVRSDPHKSWEDMFLMARCRHNIIANSSYSWWGAWLNPDEGKRVIAPARWLTSAEMAVRNVLDLYPDDWILLK